MNTYKYFTLSMLSYLAIFFIIIGIFIFFIFELPKDTSYLHSIIKAKQNYASSITSTKLIFTSGSNILYGIETETIEKELLIPTINLGTNAGLKTDYPIHLAKSIALSGDIIIAPFEYESFLWDGEQSQKRTSYILTHDHPYYLFKLPMEDKLKMLYSISPKRLLKSIKQQYFSNNIITKQTYAPFAINKNGDATNKTGHIIKKFSTNNAFKLTNKFEETKGLKMIKNFNLWCKKNNIQFYVSYPNTINYPQYFQKPYLVYFDSLKKYFDRNGIKSIGSPKGFLYPQEYFYDTQYHLNSKGANMHTNTLIKILNPILSNKK